MLNRRRNLVKAKRLVVAAAEDAEREAKQAKSDARVLAEQAQLTERRSERVSKEASVIRAAQAVLPE